MTIMPTKELILINAQLAKQNGYFNWVMEYKETGKAVGNISVVKLNENTEAADMGYCMNETGRHSSCSREE